MFEVLQVVRKYGKQGGMEKYVWELSHALANQGITVHILCESVINQTNHQNIRINTLDECFGKPRWLAMLRFSRKTAKWIKKYAKKECVIHSHERTPIHHVTTFHGPPFAHVRNKPFWKRISIRAKVWLYLEKRELCSNQVKVVLPNSDLIYRDLRLFYPCVKEKILPPAYPGIEDPNLKSINLEDRKNIIIFIGKEWKRKGLEFSIKIVEKIRSQDKSIEFWVLGPEAQSIKHLFKNWKNGYKLLGWKDSEKYLSQAKLLIHPAISEPYGMVISEATTFGVPVVISSNCGIANKVTSKSGGVLNLDDSIDEWVKNCTQQMTRKGLAEKIGKDWNELALDHIKIYDSIKES